MAWSKRIEREGGLAIRDLDQDVLVHDVMDIFAVSWIEHDLHSSKKKP